MKKKNFCKEKFNKKIRRFCYAFKKLEKREAGFTYVETVAVIAIGAILTAGSVFSVLRFIPPAARADRFYAVGQLKVEFMAECINLPQNSVCHFPVRSVFSMNGAVM